MAFYKDTKRTTKQEKRTVAEARGGFEDEGSQYSGRGRQDRRQGSYQRGGQGQSAGGKGGSERKPYGKDGDRPRYEGESRGGQGGYQGTKPQGGRSGYQGNSGQGNRSGYQGNGGQGNRSGYQGNGGQGNRSGYRSNDAQTTRDGSQGSRGGYQGNHYQGNRANDGQGNFDQKRHGDAPSYPSNFREGTRNAPRGERPQMDRRPPRFDRKDGNYRFSSGSTTRYTERGDKMTPRPYDEQRRARIEDDGRHESYRYAAPVAPAPAQYGAPTQYGAPVGEEMDIVPNENLLSGRNPIREALKSGRDIEKLLIARGELSGSAREIVQMAKERHIPVQEVDRVRLDAITHNHQGMLAFASAYQYSTVDDMLALAKERGEEPFLVLLDGITDPHNLGAIIRTAECAGAHGVVVQERRAVGLTPAAVKASAGAVEYLPVARVTNLTSTIEALKVQNIWVYAADMSGESYDKVDFSGAVALVIGAEGEGISHRVLENSDKKIAIPMHGKLESLNASVAAGILLYAVIKSR